jgi:hypothetical protein
MSLLGILCASYGFAQVRGRVLEIDTELDTTTVPGVIVLWSNSSVNTTTDENGRFSIPVIDSSNQLHIRAIGYEPQVITIKDTLKFITVILKNGINLKEVEVVYESTGTELSYMNPIKVETLGERSLMKAACCNLSESF